MDKHMQSRSHEFGIKKITETIANNSEAVVFDGDRTVWKGNAMEHGICMQYILRELRRGHLPTAAYGINGYFQVKRMARERHSAKDSVDLLGEVYSRLSSVGLGNREEMQDMAFRYIRRNMTRPVRYIMLGIDGRKPYFLATCNGSSVAAAAENIIHPVATVSNIDIFGDDGMIKGVKVLMRHGEDKVRETHDMLSRHGIRFSKCAYIGDSEDDIPAMLQSGLSIASPFACNKVREIADFVMWDTMTVSADLRLGSLYPQSAGLHARILSWPG